MLFRSPGRDVHAAPRVRHGEGLRGRHDDGAAEDDAQRPVRAQPGLRQQAAVRPPKQWTDKKSKLNLDTPYNFVCTADIIGGNSGSPILNRNAEVVGLVFDGNIESLPGNYWFDERVNRCVGVHSAGMIHAIETIYGEADLVKELRSSNTVAGKPAAGK